MISVLTDGVDEEERARESPPILDGFRVAAGVRLDKQDGILNRLRSRNHRQRFPTQNKLSLSYRILKNEALTINHTRQDGRTDRSRERLE